MQAPRPVITYSLTTLLNFAAATREKHAQAAKAQADQPRDQISVLSKNLNEVARQEWQEQDEFIAATLEVFRLEGATVITAARQIRISEGDDDSLYVQMRRGEIKPLAPGAYL